jgi:hypothetical protein
MLSANPDLLEWMRAPVLDRLADIRRLDGWPLLSWCFATGRLIPDLDLLAGKGKGGHFTLWVRVHAADEQRARQAAEPFDWCAEWTTRIVANALPFTCMTRARTLGELGAQDLDAVEAAIEASPVLTNVGRAHLAPSIAGCAACATSCGSPTPRRCTPTPVLSRQPSEQRGSGSRRSAGRLSAI